MRLNKMESYFLSLIPLLLLLQSMWPWAILNYPHLEMCLLNSKIMFLQSFHLLSISFHLFTS